MRRKLLALVTATIAAFAGLGVMLAPAASAHPLGNFTVNRYSGLVISPGRIDITWVLDMAEIPTQQERSTIDADGDGRISVPEGRAWADEATGRILRSLALTVDGRPVGLRSTCDVLTFHPGQASLPILRLVAGFTGAIPVSGHVEYRDLNYTDRVGWKEVTVAGTSGVTVSGSTVRASSVSDQLRRYPRSLLNSPLAQTGASFSYRTEPAAAAAGGGSPCTSTSSGSPATTGGAFAALVNRQLTPVVLVLSLLLAFAFGALHAVGPGHGKTITAAYLVGKGARVRQAVTAGLAVSFMHTLSVLALGLFAIVLFHSFPAERVYPWLGLVTGLVALGLGTALLVVRVRARRQGVDPWHGHTHTQASVPRRELALVAAGRSPGAAAFRAEDVPAHLHPEGNGHTHAHPEPSGAISRRGLAALAVSGGILPSPTALVVLTAAIAYHRVGYGLGLIVAFSLGLATALVAIALLALRARSLLSNRLGSRVGSILPIVSAAVIAGFGLFFLVRGVVQVV